MKRLTKIVTVLLISLIFIGCDFCEDNSGPGEKGGELVYLTVLPDNSEIPVVYEYDIDNLSFENLVDDASIYAPPSKTGKFVFLRNSTEKNTIFLYDLSIKSSIKLEESNSLFDIANPKISSDGQFAVFEGGEGKLYAYNIADKVIDKLSNNYLDYCSFTISPDSKKIAFFETLENSSIVLTVLDANAFDNKIYSKDIGNAKFVQNVNQAISWNNHSSQICYGYQLGENAKIDICSLYEQDRTIDIDRNLGCRFPVLSNDEEFIAFVSDLGDIWVRSLNTEEPVFSKLTNYSDAKSAISQIFWADDDENIYFLRSLDLGGSLVFRDLMSVSVSKNKSEVLVKGIFTICNNVFNAIN